MQLAADITLHFAQVAIKADTVCKARLPACPLKECYRKLAAVEGEALTDFSVARLLEMAVEKMEKTARDKAGPGGCSILASGFRAAGLVPYNPAIFTEESFAASDALLGHHKAHPSVEKAKKTGQAMS